MTRVFRIGGQALRRLRREGVVDGVGLSVGFGEFREALGACVCVDDG
jgi:hypothetical protein